MHTNKKKRIRIGWRYQTGWNDHSPQIERCAKCGEASKGFISPGAADGPLPAAGGCTALLQQKAQRVSMLRKSLRFHPAAEQV